MEVVIARSAAHLLLAGDVVEAYRAIRRFSLAALAQFFDGHVLVEVIGVVAVLGLLPDVTAPTDVVQNGQQKNDAQDDHGGGEHDR